MHVHYSTVRGRPSQLLNYAIKTRPTVSQTGNLKSVSRKNYAQNHISKRLCRQWRLTNIALLRQCFLGQGSVAHMKGSIKVCGRERENWLIQLANANVGVSRKSQG